MTGQFPKGTAAPPNFPLQPGAAPGVNYGATAPAEATQEPEAPVVTKKPRRTARKSTGTNAEAVAKSRVSKAAKPARTRKAARKAK